MSWHEWLCHTNFSFLIGASHPKEMVAKAIEYGYKSLTITDYDGVYGVARAYRELQKFRQQGVETDLTLYYGAEIHLSDDHDRHLTFQDTLVLVAQTHQGYFNLCRILSFAHRDGKHRPTVPLMRLVSHSVDGLVAIQPMRGVLRTELDSRVVDERFSLLKRHFKDRVYVVVSRHGSPAEDCWIEPALALAGRMDLKILMSQDVYFHEADRKRLSDLLQAIRHNRTLDDSVDQMFVNDRRYPLPVSAIQRLYGALPVYRDALMNSAELASSIRFDLSELRYQYPSEMVPEGMSTQDFLGQVVWRHARERFEEGVPEKVSKLLHYELDLVQDLGFSDYFLTVYDIVHWARSQNILCQGRGSAANSAICYVLGITAVNPDTFDLLFERFISAERGDPPDIDVDFEHERREEVIQYIYQRYGRDRAAMVANVITFKSKGALRFAGKALGVPEVVLYRASKIQRSRAYRGNSAAETVLVVREEVAALGVQGQVSDHVWALWGEMADQLRGTPRHLGIHSGGFVVSQLPINWLCPQEPATMPGRTVITWCKEDIEGLGFFKIDVLSLGGMTVIRKCLELVRHCYGRNLSLDQIPQDCSETYDMICAADTVGTFQIESRAQMSFLPRHKPRHFYDLVVEVAIIRPGPIQGGMIHPYLKRRNGEEPITYPDPRLEPILKRTFGVPIFQEQVMRIAIAVGGFTPGEADELRKNIGAFQMNLDPDFWVQKLVTGMRRNGIDESFVEGIVGHIKGFASYGFPESHAASFALLAYATSYLKCHYPAAFFTAILNSQPMGFYAPDTLLRTARRLGVQVFPICIMESTWDHQLVPVMHHADRIEYGIRLGFRLVRGVSRGAIERIELARNQGVQWDNMMSFLHDVSLSRVDVTALAAANAFQIFGLDRKSSIWLAESVPVLELIEEQEKNVLFCTESELESVQLDYHSTGTSCGEHPTELMKRYAWVFDVPVSRLVPASFVKTESRHGHVIFVFGMVICRQAPPTAKGMMFVTLWDATGAFDLVVRPDVYMRFRRLIDDQSFLCVKGVVQAQDHARSILVTQVLSSSVSKAQVIRFTRQNIRRFERGRDLHQVRNYM